VDFEQKKGEIAHKALYAFAFDGFHKTSLNAIARMCGIGRTTIYEYFHDKDEIFAYSLDHSFDLMKLDFQGILDSPGLGCLERVTAIIQAILTVFYEDRRILFLLLAGEPGVGRPFPGAGAGDPKPLRRLAGRRH
jgi:AcrR family transcriptional regulator